MVSVGSIRRLRVTVDADIDGAVRGLRSVDREADQAGESMERMAGRSERLAARTRALKTAFIGTAAVTAGLAAGMYKMAQSGMEIDSIFKMVETTSGASAEEMEEMRSAAARVGAELPVTMNEVAGAFKEMSFAGFSAAESMDSIRAVSELASSGAMTVDESARIVTSTLNQFNLEANQADNVASSLAGTFASSATTMPEMAQALEYVGGTANAAGQDLTQVSAALGILANAGRRGSKAGTEMQNILSRLADPTDSAQEAMAELGLSVSDLTDEQGNFRDLNEIVRLFGENMAGLGTGDRLRILTEVFGQRGARSMAALTDSVEELDEQLNTVALTTLDTAISQLGNLEGQVKATREEALGFEITPQLDATDVLSGLRELGGTLDRATFERRIQVALGVDESTAEYIAGRLLTDEPIREIETAMTDTVTAADLAAGQMETVAGKIEYIQGSIESVSYTLYGGFQPAIGGALDVGIEFVDMLTSNEQAVEAFGAALVPLLGGLATLTGVLGVAYLESVAQGMYAASRATRTFSAASWAAANASRALHIAMGPVGWAILAIGAAVTAYMTNFLGFRDWVDSTAESLSPFTNALRSAGRWVLDLAGALAELGGALLGFGIRTAIDGLELFLGVLDSLVGGAGSDAIEWANDFSGAIGRFLAPLRDLPGTIRGVSGSIRTLSVGDVFSGLTGSIDGVIDRMGIFGGYLRWANRGGLLGSLVGDFTITGAAISAVTDPLGTVRDYLRWLNRGGFLAPVLGEFVIWEGALDDIEAGWDSLAGAVSGTVDRYFLRPLSRLDESLQTIRRYIDTLGLVAEETAESIARAFDSIESFEDIDIQAAVDTTVDAAVSITEDSTEAATTRVESWIERVVDYATDDPIGATASISASFVPGGMVMQPAIDDMRTRVADQLREDFRGPFTESLAFKLGRAPPGTVGVESAIADLRSRVGRKIRSDLEDPYTGDIAVALALTSPGGVLLQPALDDLRSRVGDRIRADLEEPFTGNVATAFTLTLPGGLGMEPAISDLRTQAIEAIQRDFEEPLRGYLGTALSITVPGGAGFLAVHLASETDLVSNAIDDLEAEFGRLTGILDRELWQPFKTYMPETAAAIEHNVGLIVGAFDWLSDAADRFLGWADRVTSPRIEAFFSDIAFAIGWASDELDELSATTETDFGVGGLLDDLDRLLSYEAPDLKPDITFPDAEVVAGALFAVLPPSIQIPLGFAVNLYQNREEILTGTREMAGDAGRIFLAVLDRVIASFFTPWRIREIWGPWVDEAVTIGEDLVDAVISGITSRLPTLSISGGSLVETFSTGILDNRPTLRGAIRGLFASILPFFPASNAQTGPLSDLYERGQSLARTLAAGVRSVPQILGNAVRSVAADVPQYLPGRGDADTGPLSRLHAQGGALVRRLSAGVHSRRAEVGAAVQDAAASVQQYLPGRADAETGPLSRLHAQGGAIVRRLSAGVRSLREWVGTAVRDAVWPVGQYLPGRRDAEVGPLSRLHARGGAIMRRLAAGVRAGRGALSNAIRDSVSEASQYLPSSDADRGPLSTLTEMGRSLPLTLASGIRAEASAAVGAAEVLSDRLHGALPDSVKTTIEAAARTFVPGGGAGVDGVGIGGTARVPRPALRPPRLATPPRIIPAGRAGSGGQTITVNAGGITMNVTAEGVADVEELRAQMREFERQGKNRLAKELGDIVDDIMTKQRPNAGVGVGAGGV